MAIHTLVVDPEVRNRGLGERLVRFAVEYCRAAGVKAIRLDTHYRNVPARNLYEKCGFRSLGKWEAFVNNADQEFAVFEYLL